MYVDRERAGTGPEGERGSWQQCAAVHRHSLHRLNTINDSPPKKKKDRGRDVRATYDEVRWDTVRGRYHNRKADDEVRRDTSGGSSGGGTDRRNTDGDGKLSSCRDADGVAAACWPKGGGHIDRAEQGRHPESGYESAGSSVRTYAEAASRAVTSHKKPEQKEPPPLAPQLSPQLSQLPSGKSRAQSVFLHRVPTHRMIGKMWGSLDTYAECDQ